MEIKRGILYISLHNQLIKKFGVNRTINKKEVYAKLGRHYMIPKNLRELTIKEMEEKGLIKINNQQSITILPCKIDIDNAKEIYKLAGLIG